MGANDTVMFLISSASIKQIKKGITDLGANAILMPPRLSASIKQI